ncbi:MAG: PEP-CTERM sorting domain-containing protein [Verrucomicrobiales bacterium]
MKTTKHSPLSLSAQIIALSALVTSSQAATLAVTTADGAGFDGTLTEVDYSAAYSGSFDTTSYRNNIYQTTAGRHLMTVLKFDLSGLGISTADITDVTLSIQSQNSGSVRTRTMTQYTGDDALITTSLLYDAANPFIDDSYTPETDVDTDFDATTTSEVMTFSNATAPNTAVIGSGNASFLSSVTSTIDGDGFLTLILHGGNSQWLPYSDNETTNLKPTLTITYVPEPSAFFLSSLGLLAFLRRRR